MKLTREQAIEQTSQDLVDELDSIKPTLDEFLVENSTGLKVYTYKSVLTQSNLHLTAMYIYDRYEFEEVNEIDRNRSNLNLVPAYYEII